MVVYNSDHGDYLGDFNMILKGALPFESITRVPFIWSDPQQREPRVSSAMASTVDIGATILKRAGLQPFNGNQGEPDAVSGGRAADDLLVEYNDGGSRLGFKKASRVRSVADRWRYTLYLDQTGASLWKRPGRDPQSVGFTGVRR